MKRKIASLFKITALLILLLGTVFGLIQTRRGKEMLAAYLSRTMSRSDNLDVQITGIHGWIPADMHVDRIGIGDADGTWLVMTGIESQWAVWNLFKKELRFKNLAAQEIEMMRFPKSGERIAPREQPGGWTGRMDILLEGWSVERLKLGRKVAGVPLEYTVRSGGVLLSRGRLAGGLEIRGDAVGRVELEAGFGVAADHRMMLRAELEQLNNPTFGLDSVSGRLEAELSRAGLEAGIAAELKRGETEGRLSATVRYASRTLQVENFRFETGPCLAAGDLAVSFTNHLAKINVDAGFSDGALHDYALEGEVDVATSNKTWAVQIPRLEMRAWDAVTMEWSGRVDKEQLALSGSLNAFDLRTLPFPGVSNFTGRASGRFTLQGTPGQPEGTVALDVTEFRNTAKALDELPRLDFRIAGGIAGGRLFAETSITNFAAGYLEADLSLPCTFSVIPFAFEPDRSGLDGSIDAILDLDLFNALALMEDQHLGGIFVAELDLVNARPSGFMLLENGAYEHYEWGILFRDFNARLDAEADGFSIRHARATDGAEGTLNMGGALRRNGPDITLNLTKAGIVHRPEIEADISGKLTLDGPWNHPAVAGTLVVDRADLLPDNIVAAKPRLLENYDVNQQMPGQAPLDRRTRLPVGLDIRIEMPDQIYVNASLIDSVWGGSLHLYDAGERYAIRGELKPRRGYIDFIGKKFRFQDGSIEIDSDVRSMPVMNNLTAEYSRSDITARLILNGNVNDPAFILESTPALPQDEILSQILFKRDASSISPYQAVQIASAAQQLSGGLNGPGFMYQFRQAVGVDTLEWREPDTDGGTSSVAAGKYLTPELYVEVSSSFGEENQTDMTAEYEINRHFSVETSAGPKLRPGIGINWKTDY